MREHHGRTQINDPTGDDSCSLKSMSCLSEGRKKMPYNKIMGLLSVQVVIPGEITWDLKFISFFSAYVFEWGRGQGWINQTEPDTVKIVHIFIIDI